MNIGRTVAVLAVVLVSLFGARPAAAEQLVVTETQKLVSSDAVPRDAFGGAVAVYQDTAVIGAPHAAGLQGAVYVFERTADGWIETDKLMASDAGGPDLFGNSLALQGDTLFVAVAPQGFGDLGGVYWFERVDGVFLEQAKLVPEDLGPDVLFGNPTLGLDGDTLAVPSRGDDSYRGAVYLYTRRDGTWLEEDKLKLPDGEPNDCFGSSVALFADTLIVGAHGRDEFRGAAFVFERSEEGTWVLAAELEPALTGYHYGLVTATTGELALVGGGGGAHVWARADGWAEQAQLIMPEASPTGWGADALALMDEVAVLGAVEDDSGRGAAFFFERIDGEWQDAVKVTASDGAQGHRFGGKIAHTASTVLIASYGDEDRAPDYPGAVYVFDTRPLIDPEFPEGDAGSGCGGCAATRSVSPGALLLLGLGILLARGMRSIGRGSRRREP